MFVQLGNGEAGERQNGSDKGRLEASAWQRPSLARESGGALGGQAKARRGNGKGGGAEGTATAATRQDRGDGVKAA